MLYTIKQISDRLEVSSHTLRFYEKENIIENIQRDENGNRQYSLQDVKWIYLILCLRETGMPLKEIKTYVAHTKKGRETVPERYHMISNQKQKAVDEMERLHQKITVLEDKLLFYSNLLQNKDAKEEWNPSFDFISKKFGD